MGFRRYLFLTVVLVLLGGATAPATAQDSSAILQVSIPEFMRNVLDETIFQQFEADNPGVTVKIVYSDFDALSPTSPASSLDDHLQAASDYASSADVLAVTSNTLSVEATRAGYFLDLSPLVNGDSTLNIPDFIPAVWNSFQCDQGVWALPVSEDITILTYDPDAFDQAGLSYPDANWTMDDLANAARTLAQRNVDNSVSVPGLEVTNGGLPLLFRSLLGHGFYDPNTLPTPPQLDDPALEQLLTTWLELENDGVAVSEFSEQSDQIPMRIEGSFGLVANPGNPDQTPYQGALLPGGYAGLDVQGFAVSAGTLYPEQAYALAKFLTNSVEVANNPFGVRPARQSLAGVEAPTGGNGNGGGRGGGFRFFRANSPEVQAAVDMALPNGLPVSELIYSDYVNAALTEMRSQGVDAAQALQDAETQAITNLQTARDRRANTVVSVATPVPEIVLQPGEVALNFGMTTFINPMPNRDQWTQLINDFVANDPQVGEINLNTDFGPGGDNIAGQSDCFYLPYNAVPSSDLTTLLNLDPFLSTDPSFDPNDLVGSTLAQVQENGMTYALPIDLQPQVLRFNSDLFARAGVPAPENGWTIDQFVDALRQLKTNPDDPAPFVPRDTGTSLLILIAAYGGLPLDYRTDPPTVNFTDPATVDAIQQVLDLAKDGYIDYQELGRANFIFRVNSEEQDAIFSESLNGFRFRIEVGQDNGDNPYRMTTFPRGSQFSAAAYSVGTAYISATTQNAEACYRWISQLAQHPELFSGMPARRSLINDPTYAASQGADVVATYNQFDQLLQDPNTIAFPSAFGGASPATFLLQFWLNRAFDNYVLHDADLQTELTNAQTYAQGYQQCIASIPPLDPATQDRGDYFGQFVNCATQVDPSMASFFPGG